MHVNEPWLVKKINEFKKFLLRGNVVDLAVAVVIGAAFGAVIKATVEDLFTPLIGIFFHKDFSEFAFTVRGSTFKYGAWINEVITFILIAVVIYFLVITPINTLVSRGRQAAKPADPTTRKCPECLSEIPLAAKRCAFCASEVKAA